MGKMVCGHQDIGPSRPFQCVCQYGQAKRCPRCGYLQIIEAFPMQRSHGKRARSSWCIECWRDHSEEQRKKRKRE